MSTYKQTQEELEEHLQDQLRFLQRSADAYDDGDRSESKRIANSLRELFHDKRRIVSILTQLGRKSILFLDSSSPPNPERIMGHSGLSALLVLPDGAGEYIALLDDPRLQPAMIPFEAWWKQVVFFDSKKRGLTREDLVLWMAEKDGGTHVDSELYGAYADLTRRNTFSWTVLDGTTQITIRGAHLAAIRQICHETLKSLVPNYSKERDYKKGGEIIRSLAAVVHDELPLKVKQSPGRNLPCHCCNSGLKFKNCCGNLRADA